MRLVTLYPFSYASLKKLNEKQVQKVLCLEMSIPAQIVEDVRIGLEGQIPIACYGRSAGMIFTTEEVVEEMEKLIEG